MRDTTRAWRNDMLYPEFLTLLKSREPAWNGKPFILGVSGGVDSMVMLHLFSRSVSAQHHAVIVCHANYGLRGQESDDDEDFVVRSSRQAGFSCVTKRLVLPEKENIQDAARRYRQSFFLQVAQDNNAAAIVTAHHMLDQAETILLHVIRGSGLKGLIGMRMVDEAFEVPFFRPLLHTPRSSIERYARENEIVFRSDSSNDSLCYRRNVVRKEIMPLLQKMNPQIEQTLMELGRSLQVEHDALDLLASLCLEEATLVGDPKRWVMARDRYLEFPEGLRRRIMAVIFERLSGGSLKLNADHMKRIDQISQGTQKDASYCLPSPWSFRRKNDHLILETLSLPEEKV